MLVTYSSTYVLVALSIDRYDAICHPMNFSRGCKCPLEFAARQVLLAPSAISDELTNRTANRATGADPGRRRVAAQRHLLDAHAPAVRGGRRPGPGAVLDRPALPVAVATLPDSRGRLAARAARLPHLRLLRDHRAHHLGPVGRPHRQRAQSPQQQQRYVSLPFETIDTDS